MGLSRLIIGCGNPDRGDDAAGLLVVQQLRAFGVEAQIHTGEPLELIEAWNGADEVVVVDAVATGQSPGTVHRWDGRLLTTPRSQSASTHGFSLAEVIELACVLGRLPQSLWVYGIEGREFGLGAGISPEVERAVGQVAQQIARAL